MQVSALKRAAMNCEELASAIQVVKCINPLFRIRFIAIVEVSIAVEPVL